MRISDDRYSRDRLRLDLALRFIHHEARTHTIRAWTGLTDDRIRKLYRTYLYEADGAGVARHRGKSPRQAAFFTRSLAHAARGGGVRQREQPVRAHHSADHLGRQRRARARARPSRAARCCARRSRPTRALIGESQISFEHAVFLLGALLAGDELRVAHCRDCSGVLVTDRLALRIPVCNECSTSDPHREVPVDCRPRSGAGGRAGARCGRFVRVTIRPTLFAGPFLERRAELRDDPAWIAAARADSGHALSADRRRDPARDRRGDRWRSPSSTGDHPLVAAAARRRSHVVRLVSRHALRAASSCDDPGRSRCPADTELRELRPLAPLLPPDSASLLAYARALALWKAAASALRRMRRPESAGARRPRHALQPRRVAAPRRFPRLDPAIIVLVTDSTGERALLGRQASWPAGRYSTIAGFVEPGESLEDAVIREVEEETGVLVGDVEYDRLTTLAFPVVADAGISRGGAHPRHHAARRRTRGRPLVHARRPRGGPPRAAAARARSPRGSSTPGSARPREPPRRW